MWHFHFSCKANHITRNWEEWYIRESRSGTVCKMEYILSPYKHETGIYRSKWGFQIKQKKNKRIKRKNVCGFFFWIGKIINYSEKQRQKTSVSISRKLVVKLLITMVLLSGPKWAGNVLWILAWITLLFWLHREENYLASVSIQCWKQHFQTPFVCVHALATVKNNFRRRGPSFYESYCGLL